MTKPLSAPLTIPAEEEQPIGIGARASVAIFAPQTQKHPKAGRSDQRHGRHLKEYHRILYYNLLTTCKLKSDLANIDRRRRNGLSGW